MLDTLKIKISESLVSISLIYPTYRKNTATSYRWTATSNLWLLVRRKWLLFQIYAVRPIYGRIHIIKSCIQISRVPSYPIWTVRDYSLLISFLDHSRNLFRVVSQKAKWIASVLYTFKTVRPHSICIGRMPFTEKPSVILRTCMSLLIICQSEAVQK